MVAITLEMQPKVKKAVHKTAIYYLIIEMMQLPKSTQNGVVLNEIKGTRST